MFKKAIIAAVVAAFIPAVAQAAPTHARYDRHGPAPIIIVQKAPAKFAYHNHGPKIVYKTVFEIKKVVKIVKVHGRFVKIVRWVKVPVKIAFINGRPFYRM